MLSILGEVETTLYGKCLVAEESGSANLYPVGMDETNAVNWKESTKEEWMKNFSKGDEVEPERCCCDGHTVPGGRCLQCPIHGMEPPQEEKSNTT